MDNAIFTPLPQAAITDPVFNYNGVFVIENMLATQIALEAGNHSEHINDWDLSVIDWSVNGNSKLDDLSPEYQTAILSGLTGNPVQSEIEDNFNGIWTEASGFTGCAQYQQFGTNEWDCPDAITARVVKNNVSRIRLNIQSYDIFKK